MLQFTGKSCGLEVSADQPPRRRCFFELGDDGNTLLRGFAQAALKSSRRVGFGRTLERRHVGGAPRIGNTLACGGQNCIE
jgi:hypothetical protein